MAPPQPGHFASAGYSVRERRAPHDGQNAAVSKINAMHDGQLIVASRALQYRQRGAPGSVFAPQAGQRSVAASADIPH
jgi:hypothetical protein